MVGRKRAALLAVTGLVITAVSALQSSAASGAATAHTTVAAQSNGGYITTYVAVNGDVTKVFSATPMTITPQAATSRTMTANGSTVSQHSGGITMRPTTTLSKTQLTSAMVNDKPMSPYDELLAMGAPAADIANFQDMPASTTIATAPATATTSVTPYSESGGGTQVSNPPACVSTTFDGGHGSVYGCDVTRRVATSGSVWYLTDALESTGTMHDTGCVFCDHLTGLLFGNTYSSGNVIQEWKPSGTTPVGNCHEVTASLTYKAVGVSDTSTWCPETVGVYTINATHYALKWDGKGSGPSNGARDTNAVDGVYNCGPCSYLPSVNTTWWYTTS